MLKRTAIIAASFVGLGSGLGLAGDPANAAAAGGVDDFEEYTSPDGTFALRYPAAFKPFSKPLKTHKLEVGCISYALLAEMTTIHRGVGSGRVMFRNMERIQWIPRILVRFR